MLRDRLNRRATRRRGVNGGQMRFVAENYEDAQPRFSAFLSGPHIERSGPVTRFRFFQKSAFSIGHPGDKCPWASGPSVRIVLRSKGGKATSTIDITDPRVVKALAHPLRLRILQALDGRVASPSEIADELGTPLSNTSYPVRQLAGLGFVRLVDRAARRGAIEHYYVAVAQPTVS